MSERTSKPDKTDELSDELYVTDLDQLSDSDDKVRNKHKNLPPNTGNETEKLLIKTGTDDDQKGYRDDQREEHPDEEPAKARNLGELIDN